MLGDSFRHGKPFWIVAGIQTIPALHVLPDIELTIQRTGSEVPPSKVRDLEDALARTRDACATLASSGDGYLYTLDGAIKTWMIDEWRFRLALGTWPPKLEKRSS